MSATSSSTFEEIRAALWGPSTTTSSEADALSAGAAAEITGTIIKSFLRHYGIGATSEGDFYLLNKDNRSGELYRRRGWCGLRVSVTRAIGREGRGQCWDYAA